MSTKIKQNLFRFVTLRNPQLIDKKEKKDYKGFVYHPELESETTLKSKFLAAVNGMSVVSERKEALLLENQSFVGFKTRAEVKGITPNLYQFSSWLMRNKNALSYVAIKENLNAAEPLLLDDEALIWDNLIHQTISKTSVYVREALIQILVANKFLKAFLDFSEGLTEDITFTEDQEKEFTRRAHASVVMSKEFLSTDNAPKPTTNKRLSKAQHKAIDNSLEVDIAKANINAYKQLEYELETIELTYTKANQKSYKAALDKHNADVQKLIDIAVPVIVEEIDPETGVITKIKTYPDLDLPNFSFTKEEAITETYLSDKLSEESLELFKTEGLEIYDEFLEVKKAISSKLEAEKQIITSKSPKRPKTIKIGGAVLRAQDENPQNLGVYCFSGLIRPTETFTHLSIMINTGYSNPEGTLDYTFTHEETGTTYSPANSSIGYNADGSTYIRFVSSVANPFLTGNYTFNASVVFDNGETVEYEVTGINLSKGKIKRFSGCEKIEGNQPPVASEENKQVFGVTNLGIADFRRVEQEVCCYVPGEVSHIENIMAREYKERSTRSLTSSETITERTEENERENLSDTTSTERNEMQSEVAQVLNEDESQAQGANTGVQGGKGDFKFYADAFFDSSSSSSSSNSNSQAQTYAQEVTERAMERIVQKVQTKRTSRILKEFEENNKHGFDNTKGENHVTGVYRWVDKIYKNTLINYGKRLMYEFAIPEPSKFFKEAVKKNIDNNEFLSGVIIPERPIHPTDYDFRDGSPKVLDASFINEGNYLELASEYNAEVANPPQREILIGKSFTETGAQGGSGHNHEIDIPENYYVDAFSAEYSQTASNPNLSAIIHIGDHSFNAYAQRYAYWDEIPLLSSKRNSNGVLPISISGWDISAYALNVNARCKLFDKAFEKWQSETYNAILNAYGELLREYNDAQRESEVEPTETDGKLSFNPLFNKGLMVKELKRVAIELLTDQRGGLVSQDDFYAKDDETLVSKVKKDQTLQDHIEAVKFFEQAFDWEIMAYIFYPYFYADEKDWVRLFQEQDAADPLFQGFLQSGMARTVVPVRPGFEDAVNWYMTTGEIWNGQGMVVDQDDDLYVSVAEEMQTIEGVVEGTWETRLPTALTILQADSAALLEGGLPCFCDEHARNSTIMSSSELLGGDDGAAGVGVDLLN